MSRVRRQLATATAAGLVAACTAAASTQAAAWRLDSSFGSRGVAGLPVREEGIDSLYPPGPGAKGSLLAPGRQGSLYVGGYADRKKGSFLLARLSARGRLVKGFGHGGVIVVPGIYSTPQTPPRILAVAGGKPLVVGLNRANQLVVIRMTSAGRADGTFAHAGVARYDLPDAHGHAIVAAAEVEPDGNILVAYYASEMPQPVNEPRIAPGLGRGPAELVRVLPSGALDSSFGHGGFLKTSGSPPATGEAPAAGVTLAADGSVLIAYEQALAPGDLSQLPAVQELTPAGAPAEFGVGQTSFLPHQPQLHGESSSIFGALFALPGGGVETSFGGAGELFRFTSSGAPDPTFGTSGHTLGGSDVSALAIAPDGETFALASSTGLTVDATLTSGAPDAALGGRNGRHFAVTSPHRRAREEQPALELLAGNATLSILIGEEVVRLRR